MKKRTKRRSNLYAGGGPMSPNISPLGQQYLSPVMSVDPSKVNITNPSIGTTTSGLSGAAGMMGAASGGIEFLGDLFNNLNPSIPKYNVVAGNSESNTKSDLLKEWGNFQTQKHFTEQDFNSNGSFKDTAGGAIKGAMSGASLGTSVAPGIGTAIGAGAGLIAGGVTSLFGSNKKKKALRRANQKVDDSNRRTIDSFDTRANALEIQSGQNVLANYAAYGGDFNVPSAFSMPTGSGAIAYESLMALVTPQNPDAETYKIPNFNQTFANGGSLNGVTVFNTGGTHEENPNLGIPLGIGENGLPNLVEEGEVKFNDYIFSDRIKADKKGLNNIGLSDIYHNKSMAEIAKKINKESAERPYDPISKRGLEMNMQKLSTLQEAVRGIQDANTFAKGGKKTKKTVTPFSVPNPSQLTQREIQLLQAVGINPMPVLDPSNLRGLNTPEEILQTPQTTLSYINPNIIAGTNLNTSTPTSLFDTENLRYAPVLGSAISALTSSNYTPDYSGADTIAGLNVAASPVGNYLGYTPLDRNYYLNMLNSQSGATRRAITDQSGGNRATATAGLLAADLNYLNSVGNLARQSEEYNLNQRQQVELFNRATNMFNSENDLRALTANNEYAMRAAGIRSDLANQANQINQQTRSQNWTNLFDNLGEVGRESFSRNMINTNPALGYSINSQGEIQYRPLTKAMGGKLNKKKRK